MSGTLADAFVIAHSVYGNQFRKKGRTASMISHVMGVTDLVARYGGSDVQQQAALLHEAVDEENWPQIQENIRTRLGDLAAEFTALLKEPVCEEELDFQGSKERYLSFIASLPVEAGFVLACDELHDLHCVTAAVLDGGKKVLEDHPGGIEGQLWYYGRVAELMDETAFQPLLADCCSQLHLLRRACA